jgi:hypothetical protein
MKSIKDRTLETSEPKSSRKQVYLKKLMTKEPKTRLSGK